MDVSIPIRRALTATAIFAGGGLAYRLIGGAIDPGMKSWVLVMISPLFGLLAYRQATGRDPHPPKLTIGLGVGALLVYGTGWATGGIPATPADWAWWAFILAFPIALVVMGIRKLRRNRLKQSLAPGAET